MSELTEAIRAALTEDWQSTRQIADQIEGIRNPYATNTECARVYKVLLSDAKYGLVEMQRVKRDTLWRLPHEG